MKSSQTCVICCKYIEDSSHGTFECDQATRVWREVFVWTRKLMSRLNATTSCEKAMEYIIHMLTKKSLVLGQLDFHSTVAVGYIWWERNKLLRGEQVGTPSAITQTHTAQSVCVLSLLLTMEQKRTV